MDTTSDDVLKDLVLAQYLNKNYPAALEGIDLLSKRESLPPGSWFMRATCYDKLEQPANALEAYKRFLELNKDLNNDMYFESVVAGAGAHSRDGEEEVAFLPQKVSLLLLLFATESCPFGCSHRVVPRISARASRRRPTLCGGRR